MEFTSKITSKVQPTSNIFKNLTIFIKDPMVMCNIYSDAITFYGMAAVKFWGAEYMEKILNVVDPTKRMILYGSLCEGFSKMQSSLGYFLTLDKKASFIVL